MQTPETQAPTSPQSTLPGAAAHQLDLVLDHPRLKGLSPRERQDVLVIIAQLMLEARGIVGSATKEDSDERA